MDGGKIFPALCDDELDHDVAGGLSDADCLLLFATSSSWNLSWLSNSFESVSICCLAALNCDLLDAGGDESNFVHNLSLLKLNGQLLREHAGR